MSGAARPRRIALNEARFREINERLKEGLTGFVDAEDVHGFVCECGNARCDMTVRLSFAEYERVRRDPMRFIIVPGHEIPDVEDVVERTERYAVARKHEDTRAIAEGTDPHA